MASLFASLFRSTSSGPPRYSSQPDLTEQPSLYTRCFFRFALEEYDVEVKIVGSAPQLGGWDHTQGVELHTSSEYFPCWITRDPIVLPMKDRVEYKYAIIEKDGAVRWSNGGVLSVESVNRIVGSGGTGSIGASIGRASRDNLLLRGASRESVGDML